MAERAPPKSRPGCVRGGRPRLFGRESVDYCNTLKAEIRRQVLEVKKDYEKQNQLKLEEELKKRSDKASTEHDSWTRIVNKTLQKEISSLQESIKLLQNDRTEDLLKIKDLEGKNHDLMHRMKKFQREGSTYISEVEAKLKKAKSKSDRKTALLNEIKDQWKFIAIEKEKLAEQLDTIKQEFLKLKFTAESQLNNIKIKLRNKSIKLQEYKHLENSLNKVVLRAVRNADNCNVDQVLGAYGFGPLIPTQSKARLQQSIKLAERVMELEEKLKDMKACLFQERNDKEDLRKELDLAERTILLTDYPTGGLLYAILQREKELKKSAETIEMLQMEIKKIKHSKTSAGTLNDSPPRRVDVASGIINRVSSQGKHKSKPSVSSSSTQLKARKLENLLFEHHRKCMLKGGKALVKSKILPPQTDFD